MEIWVWESETGKPETSFILVHCEQVGCVWAVKRQTLRRLPQEYFRNFGLPWTQFARFHGGERECKGAFRKYERGRGGDGWFEGGTWKFSTPKRWGGGIWNTSRTLRWEIENIWRVKISKAVFLQVIRQFNHWFVNYMKYLTSTNIKGIFLQSCKAV